jgi:DNA-binding MarR family transcriptional regulator
MTLDPHDLDLPALASLAGASADAAVKRAIADEGFGDLRTSYGYIVQVLLESEPTIGGLAESLGITQQAVSKTVAEMEERGLVERVADRADGRVRRLRLAERGHAAVAATRRVRARLEAELGVGDDELAAARAVLTRLLEHTGGLDAVRTRRVRPATD